MRGRHLAAAGVVPVALVATACGGGSSGGAGSPGPVQHPSRLVADVGHDDRFVISLTDGNNQPIRNLAAGTYSLSVDDESNIHNFHLSGSGVDASTSIGGTGTKNFTATFSPGTYSFVCDTHPSSMHGKFVVSK